MKSLIKPYYKLIKQVIVLTIFTALTFLQANAQSMGISNTAITPAASSILELRTTTKGMLIPRMTSTERDAISSPASGLIVYNTTTNKFNFYNASAWTEMISGGTVISTLNTLTASTQTLATGTTGTDFNISSATSTHTFNLPIASGTNTGKLLNTDWTTFNNKQNAFTNSAGLAAILSDETGTGLSVFSESPTFTGVPLAPTAAVGTNTTQLATTAFVLANSDSYSSVNAATEITTTSTTDVVATGMTLTPGAGTYSVMFNSQYLSSSAGVTAQAATDLSLAYNEINAYTTTVNHVPVFGLASPGETLAPGVYATSAAGSVSDYLILDAGGNANAIFIFKINGALTTAAGTVVSLTGGQKQLMYFG